MGHGKTIAHTAYFSRIVASVVGVSVVEKKAVTLNLVAAAKAFRYYFRYVVVQTGPKRTPSVALNVSMMLGVPTVRNVSTTWTLVCVRLVVVVTHPPKTMTHPPKAVTHPPKTVTHPPKTVTH